MYLRELVHAFVTATTITDSHTWNAAPPDRAVTRSLRIFDWIASRHGDPCDCDDTMSPACDDGESNSSFFSTHLQCLAQNLALLCLLQTLQLLTLLFERPNL